MQLKNKKNPELRVEVKTSQQLKCIAHTASDLRRILINNPATGHYTNI